MDSEEELPVTTDIANDYKVHRFLDLSRPMLLQLWNGGFSKEFYLQQVHKPRHYKGGESAPLFGNFLEPLSKAAWWVVPMVWLPWIIYGTYEGNKGLSSPVITASCFTLGLGIWTLVEYTLHRCLFHVDE
jgi:4-hydroxysphinganine ceramide fatty acyl 2-hydroxylase